MAFPTRAYEFAEVKPLRHVPVSHESSHEDRTILPDEVRVKATKRGIGNGSVSNARFGSHSGDASIQRNVSSDIDVSRSSKIFHFTHWSLLSRSLVDVNISSPDWHPRLYARSFYLTCYIFLKNLTERTNIFLDTVQCLQIYIFVYTSPIFRVDDQT